MSQISPLEADSLLGKLLTEKVPLHAFLKTFSGSEVRISGFLESKTTERITVSTSGPPFDSEKGSYLSVLFSKRECKLWYGEKRELSTELQRSVSDNFGESALVFDFPNSGEWLALFFTI